MKLSRILLRSASARAFIAGVAALALAPYEPALAASTTTSAQMPITGTTAGDCMSADPTEPKLADSGIVCSGNQLTIKDSSHSGITLQPSYQGQSFPGILLNNPGQGLVISKTGGAGAGASDTADVFINRSANYTGGTNGFVNSGLKVETTVSAGAKSFEWPLTSIVDNSSTSTDGGNAVGGYLQGIKRATGATWASTLELIDKTTNPTTSSVGVEIDNNATGTDSNNMRVVADLFCGLDSGASANCGYGLRVNAKSGTTIGNGIRLNGAFGNGLDLSGGSYLGAGIILGDTNHLCMDGSCFDYLFHSSGVLYYHTSSGNVISLGDTGQLAAGSFSTPGSLSAASGTFTGAVSTGALTATSLSSGAISGSSVTASGAISGSSLTSSGAIVQSAGQYHCLDGAGCNFKFFESGGLVQVANGSSGLLSINGTSGVLGIASGAAYGVGFSTGVTATKTAGSCTFTITGGIITGVSGC